MKVSLKNDFGEFVIGENGIAKLISIDGIGLPQKEVQTVTYAGQAGQKTLSMRDMPRTITITVDFYGDSDTVLRLYKMIYYKVDITIISGGIRRKISGICTNPQDAESIVYQKMYKTALQFVCDDPYFHDLSETKFDLSQRTDKFPNLFENGKYYITLPAVATERKNTTVVLNKSAVLVYPIIEIYNNTADPITDTASGIIITNETTGAKITIDRNMKPNEKISADLPNRSIKSNIDGDITMHISDDTVLSNFFLEVGNNEIKVENKNTKQETVSVIRFNNCYEAAVV